MISSLVSHITCGEFVFKLRSRDHGISARYAISSDDSLSMTINGMLHVFPGAHSVLLSPEEPVCVRRALLHEVVFHALPGESPAAPAYNNIRSCEFTAYLNRHLLPEKISLAVEYMAQSPRNIGVFRLSDLLGAGFE